MQILHAFHHRRHIKWTVALLTSLLLMCLTSVMNSPAYAASTVTGHQFTYIDQKLGFGLQIPAGWVAAPQPGIYPTSNSSVFFTNAQMPKTSMNIGVMRSSSAAAASTAFASRGKPTLYIGNYPAIKADTQPGKQVRIPCLVRIMLANNDIVDATWCAPDALVHAQQFESILATYQNHSVVAVSGCSRYQWMTVYRDRNNHINLATSQGNFVLSDTTTTTPALTCFKGQIFVAFVPNNGTGHIVVFYGGIPGWNTCPASNPCGYPARYTVAMNSGTQNTTVAAPSLSSDYTNLYLAFTGTGSHVNIAQTTDGTTAASWVDTVLKVASYGAPSTVGCDGQQWVAYTNTSSPAYIVLATSHATYVLKYTTVTAPALSCYYGQLFVSFVTPNGFYWRFINYGWLSANSCTFSYRYWCVW